MRAVGRQLYGRCAEAGMSADPSASPKASSTSTKEFVVDDVARLSDASAFEHFGRLLCGGGGNSIPEFRTGRDNEVRVRVRVRARTSSRVSANARVRVRANPNPSPSPSPPYP